MAVRTQSNNTQAMKTGDIMSREQIRTFHLSGVGLEESIPAGALRPVSIDSKGIADLEASYPLCLHPTGHTQPFRQLVKDLPSPDQVTSAFRSAMGGQTPIILNDVAAEAIESLAVCSPPEIARLRALLPEDAFLAGFHADSLVLLHAAALAEARRADRVQFWEDVRHTAARLRELLLLDETRAPGAATSQSLTAALGARVHDFLKPSILADALQRTANPLRRMDADRRARCEATLSILEEGLHDAANHPGFWIFHCGGSTSAESTEVVLFGGAAIFADDGFAASLEFCDAALDRMIQVLRALRVARLEIESVFDPVVHEEMLARFDWQSAARSELNALPPMVVVESAAHLGETSLTSFGRLLRSGRPVQILIVRGAVTPSDIREFTPEYGYLAVAHREAFVLQSSMAEPSHLLPGLATMAKALRPAVAVVSVPRNSDPASDDETDTLWLEENLSVRARTYPLFTYDPEAGMRWCDRFRLFTPPSTPDLTPIHAAAVSPALRAQFRVLPSSFWNDDQMELEQYLAAFTVRAPLAIPYIWVEAPNGIQERALLTRDLVNFCIDRQRAWLTFEELAGLGKTQATASEGEREIGAREALEKVIALLKTQ